MRTLLGIDFLERVAMVLVIPQRYWFFADHPEEKYDFMILEIGRTPELTYYSETEPMTNNSLSSMCLTQVVHY